MYSILDSVVYCTQCTVLYSGAQSRLKHGGRERALKLLNGGGALKGGTVTRVSANAFTINGITSINADFS